MGRGLSRGLWPSFGRENACRIGGIRLLSVHDCTPCASLTNTFTHSFWTTTALWCLDSAGSCNRQPAQYDEGRQELTPPYRSVLFNERLVHHDGVLAQAVSRAEGITFDEAVKAIELEVEQLKAEVTGGKTIAIDRVGRLYKGSNDRVQFLADEEMERMLRSFGLRNIPLRPIAQSTPEPQPVQLPKGKVVPMPTPSVSVPLARIAAALAVPVLGGLGMFVADSWEVQDARMSAINVPAVAAAFEPRFEGEAVPSWDDVEALEETGALARSGGRCGASNDGRNWHAGRIG